MITYDERHILLPFIQQRKTVLGCKEKLQHKTATVF